MHVPQISEIGWEPQVGCWRNWRCWPDNNVNDCAREKTDVKYVTSQLSHNASVTESLSLLLLLCVYSLDTVSCSCIYLLCSYSILNLCDVGSKYITH